MNFQQAKGFLLISRNDWVSMGLKIALDFRTPCIYIEKNWALGHLRALGVCRTRFCRCCDACNRRATHLLNWWVLLTGLSTDPLWRTCPVQQGIFDAMCDKCCFGGITRMHCNEANCRLPCQPHSGCWLDDDFKSPVSPAAVAPQAMPAPKTPAPKIPAPVAPAVPAYFKGKELT